jgi:ribose transport system substrate-binding protein
VKQEAAKLPKINLTIVDGQNDINKQVNDIESLIAMKCKVIMLIPNSPAAVQPELETARKSGIKVVDFNLPLTDTNAYDVYVGTQETQKGIDAGKWMATKLTSGGNVVELGGIPGNSQTTDFMAGFAQATKGDNIKVLAYKDCNWTEDTAKTVMADLLNTYPNIDGIVADGGQDGCGALKAMVAANRPLVPTTGDDYNGLFKMYLTYHATNPKLDVCGIAEPIYEGRNALEAANDLLNGKAVAKNLYIIPPKKTGADAATYARPNLPDGVFLENDLPDSTLEALAK